MESRIVTKKSIGHLGMKVDKIHDFACDELDKVLALICSIVIELLDLFFSYVDFVLWNSNSKKDTQCGSHRTEVRTYLL